MKLNKRSRWIIVFIILLVSLTALLMQFDSVQATFNNMHAVTVLIRVESEIMRKTPAGQYYESLLWKHNEEIGQISVSNPENNEELMRVLRLFIPGLETLVNGKGDTVHITSEQMEGLKAQLEWFAVRGSPTLQEDIQKEQQRLPLDHFVGMTMNEAWDFINSSWASDSAVTQNLVEDSNGTWAYYVHNEVYLEYPSSYFLQVSESEKDFIYFIPSTGVPEQWNPCVMKVHIWNVPATEKDTANSHSRYSPESIVWEHSIQGSEFQGIEFISSRPGMPGMNIRAFQYNQENQLAIDIWVFVTENPQVPDDFDYSTMINQRYEYFQHMVDSIHMQMP